MQSAGLVRRGWLLPLAAGLGWIVALTVGGLSPDPDSWDCNSSWDYVLTTLEAVSFILTAAAIWAVHIAQGRHRHRRYLRWAALAGAVGAVGAAVNNPIEHCADVEALGLLVWVPSVTLWLLGLLALGWITMTDRVLPRWGGAAILIGLAGLLFAGEGAGFVIHAGSWLVVAVALRPSTTEETATGISDPVVR